jgi:hypothetical protein
MKSYKILDIVGRVYDNVEIALWAILLAFVVFMAVFVVPMLPKLRAQYQQARAQQIAEETALYCQKLNVKAGTQGYGHCLLVLGEFRHKVEQRIYSESAF